MALQITLLLRHRSFRGWFKATLRKISLWGLLGVWLITGCSTVSVPRSRVKKAPVQTPPSALSKPIRKEPAPAPAETTVKPPTQPATAVVFGKTDFKGVLKTNYVELAFVNLSDEEQKYYLYIGEQLGPNVLALNKKQVEPGYFFLNLPVGDYRITSISIPVGSTQAKEETRLTFRCTAGKITYIGTLEVNGVGEKIKFGGIPLIMPGFDYELNVLDERQEAFQVFHKKYPLREQKISVELMQDESPKTFR